MEKDPHTLQEGRDRSFTLTRTVAATRRQVFKAWTEPEHLGWFYNPEMPTPADPIEVDLRVGGTWKQQMVVNPDLSYPTGGVYLDIEPDKKLVFRWGAVGGWPELDGQAALAAPIVTVQLADSGAATEVALTVEFPDQFTVEEVRQQIDGGTRAGWAATLDRVAGSSALVSTPGPGPFAGPRLYLLFPGTAQEALTFYAGIFGGELSLHSYGDFGRNDGPATAIAHGELSGAVSLAGADAAEGENAVQMQGAMLSLLGTAESSTLHRWFDQLSEGGSVVDPLAPKPWGASDGQVVDRHGLHWLIGYEPESVPEPEA